MIAKNEFVVDEGSGGKEAVDADSEFVEAVSEEVDAERLVIVETDIGFDPAASKANGWGCCCCPRARNAYDVSGGS